LSILTRNFIGLFVSWDVFRQIVAKAGISSLVKFAGLRSDFTNKTNLFGASSMSEIAFQDQGSVVGCFGCGPDNEHGLQIKSYWEGDEAICTWRPEAHHCGGSTQNLNGGIIACLMDCHSLNLAIAHAYKNEGRAIGTAPRIAYVTGSIHVSYQRPTPLDQAVSLRARVTKVEGRKTSVYCTLSSGGTIRATSEVLAVRVSQEGSRST
jgi:acyl-coenzyme A thioesterase PaaI-like protein